MEYEVKIDKNEKMIISVLSNESVTIKIRGGSNFKKEHGYTHLSHDGLRNLIEALNDSLNEMEKMEDEEFDI